MICIYCLKEKPSSQEHVIPQAFGTFSTDTPTLQCVCQECNNRLGAEIDQVFAKDTLEGYARHKLGKLSKKKSGLRRIETRLATGPMAGAIMEVDQSQGTMKPLTQVIVENKNNDKREGVSIKTLLADPDRAEKYNLDPNKMGVIAPSAEEYKKALAELEDAGISIRHSNILRDAAIFGFPDAKDEDIIILDIDIQGRIDRPIIRAIGKILLNFCAYKYGEAFAREWAFNELRSFINTGTTPHLGYIPTQLKEDLGDLKDLPKKVIVKIYPTIDGLVGEINFWGVFLHKMRLTRYIALIEPLEFHGDFGSRPMWLRKI